MSLPIPRPRRTGPARPAPVALPLLQSYSNYYFHSKGLKSHSRRPPFCSLSSPHHVRLLGTKLYQTLVRVTCEHLWVAKILNVYTRTRPGIAPTPIIIHSTRPVGLHPGNLYPCQAIIMLENKWKSGWLERMEQPDFVFVITDLASIFRSHLVICTIACVTLLVPLTLLKSTSSNTSNAPSLAEEEVRESKVYYTVSSWTNSQCGS
ncbi:hypothetical protein EDD22DRAFT_910685 [Suillus occidentalis]|nr:hypothetical protein EDD22DRAFT_910685 [Suillus occidentalis]